MMSKILSWLDKTYLAYEATKEMLSDEKCYEQFVCRVVGMPKEDQSWLIQQFEMIWGDLKNVQCEKENPATCHSFEKYVKKRIDRLSFFADKISNLHRKKDGSLSTLNKQLVELNDKFKALTQELGK